MFRIRHTAVVAMTGLLVVALQPLTAVAGAGRLLVDRVARKDPQGELFLVDLRGKERRITHSAGSESSAVFSPDGRRIAYVFRRKDKAHYGLYVAKRDGSHARKILTGVGTGVKWSPDGKFITYLRPDGDAIELGIVSPDGKRRRTLATAGYIGGDLEWSPDSQSIVFVRFVVTDHRRRLVLHSVDRSGGDPLALTEPDHDSAYPSFSPDGSRIVFTRWRKPSSSFASELYVMRPDGSGTQRLARSRGAYKEHLLWSPTGEWIMFEKRVDDDLQPDAVVQLWLISPDGERKRRVTRGGWASRQGIWSPNGAWVAFSSPRAAESPLSTTEVYVMRVESGKIRRLTHNKGFDDAPSDW